MEDYEPTGAGVSRSWLAPVSIFLAALAVRLIYIFALKHTLFWDAMMVDADLYDRWGLRIASGDWIGKRIFYDPPLYAYFLGIIYKLFGHSYMAVRIIQALIGSIHCVIIFYLVTLILDRRAGLLAGLIAALYMPLIFYDATVMKAFLSSTLVDGGILALLAAAKSGRYRWWLVHGICMGLAALLRLNVLLFAFIEAVVFAGILIIGKWKGGRLRAAAAALTWAIGLSMVIVPVAARNKHVSGKFVLVSSYLGQNFYTGNNPFNTSGNYQRLPFVRANPKYEEQDFRREAVKRLKTAELTPNDVSNYWLRQGLLYIRAQPGAFIKRLWLRFHIFWNAYEMPDSYNIGFIGRNFLPVLKILPGFGLIAPLGLLGMIITWRRRRELWFFYVFLIGYTASVIVFFVFSRYRMPVVGALIAFSGAALIWFWDARSRRKVLAKGSAVAVILFVLINISPPYRVLDSKPLRNLGTLMRQKNQPEHAVEYYRKAISIDPSEYEAHYFLATTLREMGKYKEAMKEYQISLKIRPNDANAPAGMAMCYEAEGNDGKAREFYGKALTFNMKLSDVRIMLIKLLIRNGEYDMAFKQVITLGVLDPMNPETSRLMKELKRKRREDGK